MEFEVRLNRKDVSGMMVDRVYRSSNGKMSLLAGCAVIVLAIVIFFQNTSPLFYPAILLACGVILPLSPLIQIRMTAKRMIDETVPDHYIIGDRAIRYSHNGNWMEIGWNKIYQIQEYRKGIVIDLSAKRITMIPRAAVPDIYDNIVREFQMYKGVVKK